MDRRRGMGRIIIDADNLEVKSAPYGSHPGRDKSSHGEGAQRMKATGLGEIKVIRYERSSSGIWLKLLIFGLTTLVYLLYRMRRLRW